jgi:hypothetical protein
MVRSYLPSLLQFLYVMDHHLLSVFGGDLKMRRNIGVEPPFAFADLGCMNIGVGGGMDSVLVHEEDGVEDLHGSMSVHRGSDVGNVPQVAIDELAQADVVVHGAASAFAAHVKLEIGDAEGVLHVHQHQPGFALVGGGRLERVSKRPVPRLFGAFLVGDPPDRADPVWLEKFRDGKFVHFVSFLIVYPYKCMSSVTPAVDFFDRYL